MRLWWVTGTKQLWGWEAGQNSIQKLCFHIAEHAALELGANHYFKIEPLKPLGTCHLVKLLETSLYETKSLLVMQITIL